MLFSVYLFIGVRYRRSFDSENRTDYDRKRTSGTDPPVSMCEYSYCLDRIKSIKQGKCTFGQTCFYVWTSLKDFHHFALKFTSKPSSLL